MRHPDEEVLAGLALDDADDLDLDPTVGDHLRGCVSCAAKVERTRQVIVAAKTMDDSPIELSRPGEHVWERISAEVATAPERPVVAPVQIRPAASHVQRRSPRRALAGAVIGFAVGVAATIATVMIVDGGDPAPAASAPVVTIAKGSLTSIGQAQADGTIELLTREGARSIRIRMDRPPSTGEEFVQAWMLDPATGDMISVGVMNRWDETLPIPDGVDVSAYDSIDLSLEPIDGDPAHSAVSLARGVLVRS